MCVGLGPIGLGIGLLQGIMQFAGQSQAAADQEQQYQANLENAAKATFDRYDAINNRVMQERAAKSQELQEAQIEAVKARGSARTAAEESNVSGLSVTNILGDMYAKQGRFERNTAVNFDYSRDYWRAEGHSARAEGQNQINSVPHGTPPNPFAAMLNIFGQAVQGYQQSDTSA
jgi:hypothetical protein